MTVKTQLLDEALEVPAFIEKVRAAYLKQFPKAWINGGLQRNLGEMVSFTLGIQPKTKIANNIMMNDLGHQSLFIFDVKDGAFLEKITVETGNSGNKLFVKPAEGSYHAFGMVKFGWRKKTGTHEQVLKHIEDYFKKMRKVVDANIDNLPDGGAELK